MNFRGREIIKHYLGAISPWKHGDIQTIAFDLFPKTFKSDAPWRSLIKVVGK